MKLAHDYVQWRVLVLAGVATLSFAVTVLDNLLSNLKITKLVLLKAGM
jgi:hypothetical protein